jgi:hypothetical protein
VAEHADLSPAEQLVHSITLNAARHQLRGDQVRVLVRYLREHAALSGPRISEALAVSRSTVYRHLQALDGDPGFAEPPVVVGKDRRGSRPWTVRPEPLVPPDQSP